MAGHGMLPVVVETFVDWALGRYGKHTGITARVTQLQNQHTLER